jgi:serine phosphatase RsbU (regulator of sigma subunit)
VPTRSAAVAIGKAVLVAKGDPPVDPSDLRRLEPGAPIHPALGTSDEELSWTPTESQLASDERLILVTDGITERRTEDGDVFGIEGIRRAVVEVENPTAAATAMAILQAVTECWSEPLEDDGTVVVLCVA